MDRPYVLLSCAMSLDGYIDDASDVRLVLSGPEDLDEVDDLRARSDAILVGAGTIRADDPRLLVRSPERREARIARGVPPDPARVILTTSGDLDPTARIFTSATLTTPADSATPVTLAGSATPPGSPPIVYAATPAVAGLTLRLEGQAEVVDAGEPLDLTAVLADLARRGVERLMVEGGESVHTSFLSAGLADELRLAIAPFFVGDPAAPRFVGEGRFPWRPADPATLVEVRPVGAVAVLTYRLAPR